ncbi:MAG: hypothetical protein COU70_01095 [Parcubacteria group bacterium CG10_big_fil_rev_8_21_14_0_10_35_15]|nr:MAG: hypothetical protein COU70_01095 [Parcubacteria group bacterium CG10_big_fil_rev_8_21_14_0_10_35_15]
MATQRWTLQAIEADLRRLKEAGEKPDAYELKQKYGFANLSAWFRTLDIFADTIEDLKDFIEEIFSRVEDKRDLNYRKGDCNCANCQE